MWCVQRRACPRPLHLNLFPTSPTPLINYFPRLEQEGNEITRSAVIRSIMEDDIFADFSQINVLPLIYDEKNQRCNILVFNSERAMIETARIIRVESGRGRKHPVYRFFNAQDRYICEVRYGGAAANALQRGLWTHTKNGLGYFESITNGWIDYSQNELLVDLFSRALVSSAVGHASALEQINDDISVLKQGVRL